MSALPPRADMCDATGDVCFGPIADIGDVLTLIDHFVCACEYRQWQGEAEFLRNLEIDGQFESGGLLHWQVGWPGAFEDLVDVGRSSPEQVRRVGPVGQKRSGVHQPARHSNEDELILFDKIPNSLPVSKYKPRAENDEGLCALARCSLECSIKIAGLPHLERLQLNAQSSRGTLSFSKLGIDMIGIP